PLARVLAALLPVVLPVALPCFAVLPPPSHTPLCAPLQTGSSCALPVPWPSFPCRTPPSLPCPPAPAVPCVAVPLALPPARVPCPAPAGSPHNTTVVSAPRAPPMPSNCPAPPPTCAPVAT